MADYVKLVDWAAELALSLGRPEASKFIYDWAKTTGGKIPPKAEVERISRAVNQGFNAVGYRHSYDPARDEQHLRQMLLSPERLADENRAFHVDLTPGAPAAQMRANNMHMGNDKIRPLALKLENVARGTDEKANSTAFLNAAANRGSTGVQYSPTEGELAYLENAMDGVEYLPKGYSFVKSSNYQPSVAMIDPTAVRDLSTAKFSPMTRAALVGGVAAGGTSLLQAAQEKRQNIDQLRATPQQRPALGGLARFLGALDEGSRASIAGRDNPPLRLLAEMLGIPALARTTERLAYGEPLTTGKGLTARPRDDTVDAALSVAPFANARTATGPLGKLAAGMLGGDAAGLAGVIKPKGGNWLSGSVEEALRGLKPRVRTEGINGHTAEHTAADEALGSWVDKQLARYVKNEMATPDDPVRALAERGVLHVNPEELNFRPEMHGRFMRPGQTAVAQSPAAKSWEGVSDEAIGTGKVNEFIGNENFQKDQDWLVKADPNAQASWIPGGASSGIVEDLGFTHLLDELRNATNPASGLPPELLLKYDSLPRVSVPQAVERVAKINEWRAAQKAEADLARANNAATVLHKEYPDKGYKWVELKPAETLNPEYELKQVQGRLGSYWDLRKPGTPYGHTTTTEAEALRASNRQALEDALKYEGDTMGHCVGGYCPDVLEGKSRIYSLRDAKGQPHVTVEVQPNQHLDYNKWFARQSDEMKNEIARRRIEAPGYDVYETPEYLSERSSQPPRIVQIKGKANRAPNEEYLPFVQDFVKSGKWSDVGDLQNTGLIRHSGKRAEALGPYSTEKELTDYLDQFGDAEPGFAQGGAVEPEHYTPTPAEQQYLLSLI